MDGSKSGDLYTALHRLGRQLHRNAHRLGHREGYYREQSRLLLLIAGNDGIIQRDLAAQMDVRPSSMTEMLAKMEQLGLVRRGQDEKDQRVMHIFLTGEGQKAAEESKKTNDRLTRELFRGLTPEEIEEMLCLVKKLTAYLDDMDSAASDEEPAHGHHRGFGCHCGPGDDRRPGEAWHCRAAVPERRQLR